ncbi:MAG TPA: ABC transporter permease [Longimicrobiales bacterium]|nr:ABC transporter permease [Longimicrobiales bacterium]
MTELLTDVRYSVRALRKSPGFTAVAVLTLALGIGANTAIFSVLDGVVLRPLPYPEPDRLVRVASQFPSMGFQKFWISPPEFFELKERNRSYASLGAYRTGRVSVGGSEAPLRATSAIATADLFTTLGVPALLGRPFNAEEDAPNSERVVTLSHELWVRAFGSDAGIVGKSIIVNGNSARVTGVMPAGFDVADAHVAIWIPGGLNRANTQNRASHYLDVVGRLKPGVTMAQAKADLDLMVRQWAELNPEMHVPDPTGHPFYATGLHEDMVGGARQALLLLLGAVGFVLLIACANVANLLLARAESRQKEIAVRAALGAGRLRLLRQFLTEGIVLSLLGGTLGVLLGYGGTRMLLAINPDGIPRSAEIGIDARVLLYALVVSVVTGLVFGLAPVMHLKNSALNRSIRDGGGRTTAGSHRVLIRRALVVAEVALAVVLVVGSSLMLRSFKELLEVDPGFEPDRLLSFQLFLPAATYPDPAAQTAFFERLMPRLKALPGVTAVAAMDGMPPRRDVNANDMQFEGLRPTPGGPIHNADYWQFVTRDYLETMQIPLVAGRGFTAADEGGPATALVNERLVQAFFPNINPIGRRLRPDGPDDGAWFTIIGVVKDVKQGGLEEETGTEVYFLHPQVGRVANFAPRTMNVVVRAAGDPMSIAPSVQTVVRELDATLPVANLATMNDVLRDSMARPRFFTLLLVVFALVALSLAAIGTYGVMAYSVTERRQEIGIRMALGAQAANVLGMVLVQGFGAAALGLVLGFAGALGLSGLLQSMLFTVSPTDPAAFITALLVLGAVALLACFIPARRATRVDPARVLKQE